MAEYDIDKIVELEDMWDQVTAGIRSEKFDSKWFSELLKKTYDVFLPYINKDLIPKDFLNIICQVNLFGCYPTDVSSRERAACKEIAKAFIQEIELGAVIESEPNKLVVECDYTDANGKSMASRDEYEYDIKEKDISDVLKMVDELRTNGVDI
jgi:hypothetical protein